MQNRIRRIEALRLTGFYFAYTAGLGLFTPYWGLYLVSLKYTPLQIGIIMALPQLGCIIGPGVAGAIADKRGKRADILRILSVTSIIIFAISLFNQAFLWQFICLFLVFIAWTAVAPLLDATILDFLHGEAHNYGKIRVGGTAGFVLVTVLGGYLTHRAGITVLPWFALCTLSVMALSSFVVKDYKSSQHREMKGSFFAASNKSEIIALYLSCFFIVLAHGIYNAFYSIHLLTHGYNKMMIAIMWMISSVSELLLFILSSYFIARFSLKVMYKFCFLAAATRFTMIGWFADIFWLIALLQFLHAFTFGMHHAACMAYLDNFYPRHLLSRAQALYVGLAYGVGAALGGVIAGALWTVIEHAWIFTLGGGLALLGFLVALRLPRIRQQVTNR